VPHLKISFKLIRNCFKKKRNLSGHKLRKSGEGGGYRRGANIDRGQIQGKVFDLVLWSDNRPFTLFCGGRKNPLACGKPGVKFADFL